MKHYSPTGRRNHGRLLKRLLDTWDRNGSTSGPTPWQIYDDDDDDDDDDDEDAKENKWPQGTKRDMKSVKIEEVLNLYHFIDNVKASK
jgi:phosphopantothenoylcysteine synthetase/decarboxylase